MSRRNSQKPRQFRENLTSAGSYATTNADGRSYQFGTNVSRDMNLEVRYCAGNAKAADLVRATGKRRIFPVTVTGEMNKGIVKVDTIAAAK